MPEHPVEVHCHHFFVFWTMMHQVLRFLKLDFEKYDFQIQMNSSYHLITHEKHN